MNIGQIAAESGVPAKTIRYYEEVGLIAPAPRRANGYRWYSETDLHTLRFIHHARRLGFPVEDVRELLALWRDRRRASADVKKLALARIDEIDRKLADLAALRRTLADLAERCHGDHRPECPILDELAGIGPHRPHPIPPPHAGEGIAESPYPVNTGEGRGGGKPPAAAAPSGKDK